MSEKKKRTLVFDTQVGKGDYADTIGIGTATTEGKLECVHISFGQLLPNKREEKEGEIIEHCEEISHVILSESGVRALLKNLLGISPDLRKGEE